MFYYFKILHFCVCERTGTCHRPHVETRGPLVGVNSLPSTVRALEVELKLG